MIRKGEWFGKGHLQLRFPVIEIKTGYEYERMGEEGKYVSVWVESVSALWWPAREWGDSPPSGQSINRARPISAPPPAPRDTLAARWRRRTRAAWMNCAFTTLFWSFCRSLLRREAARRQRLEFRARFSVRGFFCFFSLGCTLGFFFRIFCLRNMWREMRLEEIFQERFLHGWP